MRTLSTILLCLLAGDAVAAQQTTGGIQGRLVDPEARGIAAAEIVASGPQLQGERTTLSDDDGFFRFAALPPGNYTLRIQRLGFRSYEVRAVSVELGGVSGLAELRLEAEAVALEPLVVHASALTIDPVRTSVGARLTSRDYERLPTSRDYVSLVALLPHANESPRGDPVNVLGATGLENVYFIDGVHVTQPLTAESGTSLPYNFVRAVDVIMGGYEPRYGRALGAIVNAVTHSGTDEFVLDLFAFGTGAPLQATPRAIPALREVGAYEWDAGARISGPIARERLWYSVAYNPSLAVADREVQNFGVYEDRSVTHRFAARVDWHASSLIDVQLSAFGDPRRRDAVENPPYLLGLTPGVPDAALYALEDGGTVGALRVTARPTPRLLFESSISRSESVTSRAAATAAADTGETFIDLGTLTMSGRIPPQRSEMGRTAGSIVSSYTGEYHHVVLGLEYEDVVVQRTQAADQAVVLKNSESLFFRIREGASGEFHNRIPVAYLQDSWRITPHFTLTGGIRWSTQALTGASGAVAQRFEHEWQPRIGFVRLLDPPGLHRVFGSAGRYYQQLPLFLSAVWNIDWPYIIELYSVDPRTPGALPDATFDESTFEEDYREIPNLSAEHSDEFTVGYEWLIGGRARMTARAIHRTLRSAFGQAMSEQGWVLGEIGEGALGFLPRPRRNYYGVELSGEASTESTTARASWVVSRNEGNYPGLAQADVGNNAPGLNSALISVAQVSNSFGPLPNDRPHVVKVALSHAFDGGLAIGGIVTWQSGTPRNQLRTQRPILAAPVFDRPRGSVGRTPSLWDLSVRAAWHLPPWAGMDARVLIDALHLFDPQRPTWLDDRLYRTTSVEPEDRNPNYGEPLAYQPPMTIRLGVEATF